MNGIDVTRALSATTAGKEVPDRPALRIGGFEFTWAQIAERVRTRMATLVRPPAGRPLPFVAEATTEGLTTLFAALVLEVPLLLLSPKLTDAERRTTIAAADAVAEPLPDDAAVVIFTSGTTGRPKPVVLTRRNLVESALRVAEALQMTPDDVFLLSLSPARVGGLGIVIRTLVMRSTLAVSGRFQAKTFMAELERNKVTLASVVPTMLSEILDKTPALRVPPRLRALLVGGAAAGFALRRRAAEAGIPVLTTYGMTEAGSTVAVTPYEERFVPQREAGRLLPGIEAKCVNGMLALRGPILAEHYWGVGPSMCSGWYLTGDMGELTSDARVSIGARRADLIITGGENVVPREVEDVLESMPGIRSALVLGQPDETWGALVTALLVPEDPSRHPDAEAVVGYLKTRLARWKSPRRIAWVTSLPTTAAGKVCRQPSVLKGLRLDVLHYKSA